MIQLAECFAWCMVQVTLFTTAAAIVYWLVGRQPANRNARLLAISFGTIAVLTFASVSPWPQWPVRSFWQSAGKPIDTSPAAEFYDPSIFGVPTSDPAAVELYDVTSLESVTPTLPETPPNNSADTTDTSRWWLPIVWAAWIFAAIGALRFAAGIVFARRYRSQSCPIDDALLCQEFESLRVEMGAPECTELRESPALGVAATIGWHRPVILLPAIWRAWTIEERRAVLAHELAHVAQRHFPVWFASQLATVAHFYHPLVHWLGRHLRLEQELAADQLAASTFGDTRHYAAILAGLAIGRPHPTAIVSLGLFMSRPLLMRRIAMLRETTERRRPSRLVRALALVLLATAAITVVGLRTSSATDGDSMITSSSGPVKVRPNSDPFAVTDKAEEPTPSTATPTPDLPPTISTSNAVSDNPLTNSRNVSGDEGRWATAILQVSSDIPSVQQEDADAAAWKIFSHTQPPLIRSVSTVQAAVREPEIAKLPLVKAQNDPTQWLYDRLDVGFIPYSEIMYVRMKCDAPDREQSRKIIDAVVRVYMDQVVAKDRERQQSIRDTLARKYAMLAEKIHMKMAQYQDLEQELGVAQRAAHSMLLLREITEARRSKSDVERQLTEVETDFQLSLERSKAQDVSVLDAIRKEYQIRVQILNQQLAALSKLIAERTEQYSNLDQDSVDLKVLSTELSQLQAVARDMSIKLELMDVDSAMPDRIRVVQWAM